MTRKIRKLVTQILSALCAGLLAFMSLLTCYQVFMRYVIRRPSTMSEDILSYSFVWISLLATALVFGERDHMNLSFFVDKLSGNLRKAAAVFSEVLVLAVAVLIFILGGRGFLAVGALQVSPTLGVTMDLIYSILPISGVLIAVYGVLNIVEIIKGEAEEKGVAE